MEAAGVECKSLPPPLLNDEHHSANRASMPRDILASILVRLVPEVSDYIHFAAVCKGWFSAARGHLAAKGKLPFFPVLLLPTKENNQTYRGWYNPIEDRFANSRLDVPYYNKWCCGSSHGWLIFAEENLDLILYNPFTRATIRLPPMTPNEEQTRDGGLFYDNYYEIHKVVLSTDPSTAPESYEAVAVLENGMLFFHKCGWSKWILVKPYRRFEEATSFNGKFYAANHELVARIDVCSRGPERNAVSVTWESLAIRPSPDVHDNKVYLVGTSDGHLLLIDRFYRPQAIKISRDTNGNIVQYAPVGYTYYKFRYGVYSNKGIVRCTSHFKVYEVKESEGKMEFKKLKTLEGQSLFLGRNDSELIWTRDFPKYKANCIYYTDVLVYYHLDDALGATDIGVFDLETRCCKLLDVAGPGKGHVPPPIWILPRANLETTF